MTDGLLVFTKYSEISSKKTLCNTISEDNHVDCHKLLHLLSCINHEDFGVVIVILHIVNVSLSFS